MKTLPNAILTFLLIFLGTLASGSAMAQHVRFGVYLGAPFYGPGYYPYAPYYPYYPYGVPAYGYPPVAVAPASPPAYVEQGAAPLASAPAQPAESWYYCADSKTYYPYVKECPAGWQRVPAQPPSR